MPSVAQIIGMFAGALVVLVPIVKWLINDYIKKSEKLEELKRKRLTRLENKIEEFDKAMDSMKIRISEHSGKLTHSIGSIERISVKIDMFEKKMDRRELNMEKDIAEEVGKQLRTEIIKITDQISLIKGRNGN